MRRHRGAGRQARRRRRKRFLNRNRRPIGRRTRSDIVDRRYPGLSSRFVDRLSSPIGFRDRFPMDNLSRDRSRSFGSGGSANAPRSSASSIEQTFIQARKWLWPPDGGHRVCRRRQGRQFRVSAYIVRGRGLRVDSVPPPGGRSLTVREDNRPGQGVDRRTSNDAVSLICRRQSGSGDPKRLQKIEFRSFNQKLRCPTGDDSNYLGQTLEPTQMRYVVSPDQSRGSGRYDG